MSDSREQMQQRKARGECSKCAAPLETFTLTVCPSCDVKLTPSRPVSGEAEGENFGSMKRAMINSGLSGEADVEEGNDG